MIRYTADGKVDRSGWAAGSWYETQYELADALDAANARAVAAEAREAKLREGLTELVACKDLAERLDANDAHTKETGVWEGPQESTLRLDYARREPIAWNAARAAIAQVPSSPPVPSKIENHAAPR